MNSNVAENIRLIREAKGLKQDYVASKLKVTQQAYSKMENNPEIMTLQRLRDLSKILQVDLLTLLGEETVFIQQNYNQSGGRASQISTQILNSSEVETKQAELYERMIQTLKEEIEYLRSKI